MRTQFNFADLFIYDLANNHQGSFQHALDIVEAVAEVNRHGKVRGALKFQFRQLDSFIHPDYRTRTDIKYVKRFSETRLEMSDFEKLARSVASHGLSTMCTPFDEESVDILCDMGIEIIKVASCSADDWPLLERIARVNKPVVASVAGLRTEEIDSLVNFFQGARVDFALMHCVALYPTPDDKLQINQISYLKERYQEIAIGWSTHEDPQNTAAVQLAYAKGARVFERHVGLPRGEIKLNAYSSTPAQLEKWISAYWQAKAMLGAGERPPSPLEERNTLNELKRGVYIRRDVSKGEEINQEDVFFAMPVQEGQLLSGQWRSGIVANVDYRARAPLRFDAIQSATTDD